MATTNADLTADLYALVHHLHVEANSDLMLAISQSRLTRPQLHLLDWLARTNRRPTITQAAGLTQISLASASQMIDALSRRGLVTRHTDDQNFRRRRVQLTDDGRQALISLHTVRLEHIVDFADELTANERDQLGPVTHQLVNSRPAVAVLRPTAKETA